MNNDMSSLKDLSSKIGINLSDKQLDDFSKYYNLLIEWNSFMNLTAITEFDQVILKHFVDSLEIVQAVDIDIVSKLIEGEEVSVIDVGTGAGFPSLPLKIAFPNLHVTMLDSLNKRVKFLDEVIDKLELSGIDAVHGRAEDYAVPDKFRERFDIVVSRAVANLCTLSEYCIPYVKPGGVFIAYKAEELLQKKKYSDDELSGLDKDDIKFALSKNSESELAKKIINILGGRIEKIYEYNLPDSDLFRALVVVRKEKAAPLKYPRKAGLPSKEPIY